MVKWGQRGKRQKDQGERRESEMAVKQEREAERDKQGRQVGFEECRRSPWLGQQKFRNPYPDPSLCLPFFAALILTNAFLLILNLSPFMVKDDSENLAIVLELLLEKYTYPHKIFMQFLGPTDSVVKITPEAPL